MPDIASEEPCFPDPHLLRYEYDRKRDTLYITVPNPGPALSIDLGDGMWMRFIPATREVIGFEIEAFERGLLSKHPALVAAWRSAHGRGWLGIKRQRRPERFFDLITRHLRHAFVTRPHQFSLPA